MNIYDIAEKSGVSIATVSRVLNGKGNVSEKTKQHVLDIISQLGYTPNVFARGLGLNTMKMVGIICSDVADLYYATAVSTIERELRANGYDSFLCCSGDELAEKKKYIELLLSKRVDAVILVGSKFKENKDNSHIVNAAQGVPFILINGLVEGPNLYCVLCDDFEAIRQNTLALAGQGCRKFLYLYDVLSYSGSQKLEGFRQALADHPACAHHIMQCERSISGAQQAVASLIEAGKDFDAVITSDDILAIGAIKACAAVSLSIPDRVQILGFNNSILSTACIPELTSVDSKVDALSITAVRTLLDVFAQKNVPSKIVISADLIRRQTTK